MKRTFFLLALLILALSVQVFAAEKNLTAEITDITVNLNGAPIDLLDAKGNTVDVLIVEGTSYLPVRAIANALGVNVIWDESTRNIALNSNKPTDPIVKISNNSSYKNGQTTNATTTDITLDINHNRIALTDANNNPIDVLIVDGASYLPVRSVASALNLTVNWDSATRTINLNRQNNTADNELAVSETESNNATEYVAPAPLYTPPTNPSITSTGDIKITELDKYKEYIVIYNAGKTDVNLKGYHIESVKGNQKYYFGDYTLAAGKTVKIGDKNRSAVDLHWLEGKGVWNNKKSDDALLYDNNGQLISELKN